MIYELIPTLKGQHTASVDLQNGNFIKLGLVGMRGAPLKEKWTTPMPTIEYITEHVNVDELKHVFIPDIVLLGGDFCLRPHAYEALKGALEPYAELLPLNHSSENQTWYLINCINQVDAIVPEKSHYEIEDDGSIGLIEKAYLDESKVDGALLFTVKGYGGLYTYDSALEKLLREHNLVGIEFEQYNQP